MMKRRQLEILLMALRYTRDRIELGGPAPVRHSKYLKRSPRDVTVGELKSVEREIEAMVAPQEAASQGADKANSIRDRISTRRARTIEQRLGGGGWFS